MFAALPWEEELSPFNLGNFFYVSIIVICTLEIGKKDLRIKLNSKYMLTLPHKLL